ncbi:putative dehydrogenase [Novosphingobium sp. PhB165]|uniref:Gfo/Idh/MocA family protein n=1 Tax=Novosphingobium sp. PhB165 TaxID=2485105 RepID=UPI00104E33E1|nr:Gfo/Idh/MocA family oxidoreductase [Novosphingobium sp. PhB165]TCM11941.1 putative dehydrogenase [Novosphingobium sp. PhB165]
MDKMKAIVVGTGFGCRIHIPALRAAGFEVAALVGRNFERLQRKAAENGVLACYTDLDEAIAATGANLVTIATTPNTHASLAHQAIAHGCHVLCEKPFAFNAVEGKALLKAADDAGIVHMVSHEFRWLPERALFGQAIREGLIGEPRFLIMDQFLPFCADTNARLPRWWFDKEAGGGWLGAGGSHLIDQIRAWLGDFHSLSANLLTVSDRIDVAEDSYSMRFVTRSGVEGSMQQSAGAWGEPASLCRCAGSKGSVWIDAGKVYVADATGTRQLQVPTELELPPPPPAADPNSANRLSHFEIGPFTRLAEALRDAIGGSAAPSQVAPPTFHDGLKCMQIMDAMHGSAANGGTLQVLP